MDHALRPLGHQQLTVLAAVALLTVPAGTAEVRFRASGQPVRFRDDTVNPTASVGMLLPVGELYIYRAAGPTALRFIETAASATLDVAYYG